MVATAIAGEKAQGNKPIEIVPLSLRTGAEIRNVDLRRPLSREQIEQIRRALLKWKVIFFRRQHLDHAQHVAFARQFGEPTIGHPIYGHVEHHPEIYSVAKRRMANSQREQKVETLWSGWHTDVSAAVNPPWATILRGEIIPPYGGDTHWTNLAAAYEGLSEPLRHFAEQLRGLHLFGVRPKAERDYDNSIRRRPMASEHPLVIVHPETAERVLYVSPQFLLSIVGVSLRESQRLLELLWEHAIRPDYTVRYKWEPGDVAFWDNRSTAHRAATDIVASDFERQLYRITLVGQQLQGVDGTRSLSIEGFPLLSAEEERRTLTKVGAG